MLSYLTLSLAFAGLLSFQPPRPTAGSKPLVLVANKGAHTLGLIDPVTGRQITVLPESGITGHEVIASPDGRFAFVPIYGNSGVGQPGTDGATLDVFDVGERRPIHTIEFGHGVRPHCPMFGPKDGLLYVTTELDQAVTVIDPHTYKIIAKVPTGSPESHMLAISSDGTRGYTANVGPGSVSVLDLMERKTITVIPVANHVQRISVTPDGRWVFTSDTEKPRLAVIDTASNKVNSWITMPATGYGSAVTPDGKWLLIALPNAPGMGVVDLSTMQFSRTVPLPPLPQEVLIQPDGKMAYVSCDKSHQVAEVDLSDWSVKKLIDAGNNADGLAWAP
jgi:YVTN family beta-propeller protein